MWTASNLKVELQIYPPLLHLVFFIQGLRWLIGGVKMLWAGFKQWAVSCIVKEHEIFKCEVNLGKMNVISVLKYRARKKKSELEPKLYFCI